MATLTNAELAAELRRMANRSDSPRVRGILRRLANELESRA